MVKNLEETSEESRELTPGQRLAQSFINAGFPVTYIEIKSTPEIEAHRRDVEEFVRKLYEAHANAGRSTRIFYGDNCSGQIN
jgi:hypothetical protein